MTTFAVANTRVAPARKLGLRFQASRGLLTFTDGDGALLLDSCWAVAELSDGTRYTTRNADTLFSEVEGGAFVRTPGNGGRPELRWNIALEDGHAARLWLEIENTTGRSLPIERLDVLVAPTGFRQVPATELEVAQTGWQSWSPATPPVALWADVENAPPPVIGPMLFPTEAERTLAPWMSLLRTPDGHSFLAGFTSAFNQAGVISIQPALRGHRCVASSYGEGVNLPPGQVLRSEAVLLVFDQEEPAALERYALALAEAMHARKWPDIPTGWCSWYYFFTGVSEEDVLRNLDYISAERHRMPVEYVQLDDGYQAHIGDWLALNSKFPHGMRFLTDAIRAQGYKPGLWFAPFLVSEYSDIYARHPDWLLRDEHGLPVNAIYNWNSNNYALDVTHPEAAQWLRHVVATMVGEWGYDYLKIDFIYAGAMRGVRYDGNCTSIQAYRRGLEIIRQAAGDRFILGCGAPFAPSVGLVDGMRIGPDVAPFWRDERDAFGSAPALNNAVRSTLAHLWMHRRLWVNDPDCLLVRERDSALTLPEVQSWTSIVGMSGGMALLSDDLSRLEPERAALIPLVFPVLGEAATPLGPVVDGIPTRMRLDIERDWERWFVASIFNWANEPQPVMFDPAEWGLAEDTRYHLFDLWTGEHYGPCVGPVSLGATPAHGVRHLTVHTDLGRPQLVGSTLHLLGGATELAAEAWTGDTLTLTLDCPGEHMGKVLVHVPPPFEYVQSQADPRRIKCRGNLLSIPVHLAGRTVIELRFARSDPS